MYFVFFRLLRESLLLCCIVALIGCERPAEENEGNRTKELREIKRKFESSNIRLPEGSTFVDFGIEREHYIHAIVLSGKDIGSISANCTELRKVNEIDLYKELKARAGEFDIGVLVPSSATECEWLSDIELWRQSSLQTSKGFISQIEVFKDRNVRGP